MTQPRNHPAASQASVGPEGVRQGRRSWTPSLPGAFYALFLPVVLGACMAHTPIRLDLAPVGSQVQVTVDPEQVDQGTAFLVDLTGPALRGTLLDNQILPTGTRTILLSVPAPQGAGTARGEALEQRVRLREAEILSVELRSMDRTRTAVAVGAGTAAIALAVAAIVSGRAGGSGEGPPSGPEQSRGPLP